MAIPYIETLANVVSVPPQHVLRKSAAIHHCNHLLVIAILQYISVDALMSASYFGASGEHLGH